MATYLLIYELDNNKIKELDIMSEIELSKLKDLSLDRNKYI